MNIDKEKIFNKIEKKIVEKGLKIKNINNTKPWGGFFVIDETQAQDFADVYFDGLDIESLKIGGKLSPKILVVAPKARLSWQYHYRRAEIWRVVDGIVGVKRSLTDTEGELREHIKGEQIKFDREERHRLIGLDDWGVVAEIWQHTDFSNPSDEDDIVRLQDDFGR